MIDLLIKYGKQASTWRGIVAIITTCGVSIKPELAVEIASVGVTIAGAIEVFRNENTN